MISRVCNDPKCTAECAHPRKMGGYCSARKAKHWNAPIEAPPWWVKCECGAASCKTKANPTPVHSDWCPYYKFIKD